MKNIILIFLIALIFPMPLASCAKNKEVVIEEENISDTDYTKVNNIKPDMHIEETNSSSDDPESLDSWLGFYAHSGYPPEKQSGYIGIDFIIYQEDWEYLGYLNLDGRDETHPEFYERVLVEIRGTQDMILVFFAESFSDEEERGNIFDACQKGDLLFSLRNEEDSIKTVWANMKLNEREDDLERGFVRTDYLLSLLLRNTEDRANFLRAFGIMEGDVPFYQYYDDEGALQLELYYDTKKSNGVGILHGAFSMSGFGVGKYECEVWQDHKFSTMTDTHDASHLAEYAEYSTYNDKGQLTNFYSEGIIEGWKDSPYLDKVVEIEFIYRKDGTLEQKKCWYNARLFGTTRASETYFYDSNERLTYVNAYITHGDLEDYYIYENGSEIPSFCLTLDHMGWNACEDGFVKY